MSTYVEDISFDPDKKKDFLFVGTLYKTKGLDVLIHSFAKARSSFEDKSIKLKIVGEGKERPLIEAMIKELGIEDSVVLCGAIYDEKRLADFFVQALICISPNQAGLSVPKSMGYGVPFVTKKNAVTGGEIYHITPGVNGVLYNTDCNLVDVMIDAANHKEKYIEMGVKAKEYYTHHASIEIMANGAIDAIKYVVNNENHK
ncbi:MAG: glycosyltransferase family 4 protein [Prevotella sp.]